MHVFRRRRSNSTGSGKIEPHPVAEVPANHKNLLSTTDGPCAHCWRVWTQAAKVGTVSDENPRASETHGGDAESLPTPRGAMRCLPDSRNPPLESGISPQSDSLTTHFLRGWPHQTTCLCDQLPA